MGRISGVSREITVLDRQGCSRPKSPSKASRSPRRGQVCCANGKKIDLGIRLEMLIAGMVQASHDVDGRNKSHRTVRFNGCGNNGGAMRIACCSWLLLEGFQKAGCDVVPFQLDATQTLDAQIDALGIQPDLIFIQLFGKTNLPREIFKTKHKLAAYCIDSVLNEYWLIPLSRLFDFVYVDQLSSVQKFRRNGVHAKWLPLCVSEDDFREKIEKKYFLTFVGRMTSFGVAR